MARGARRRNARHGLTGYLHIEGTTIVQYLEGPVAPLARLFGNIARDPLHTDLSLLANGILPGRRFSGWAMAFSGGGPVSFAATRADQDDWDIDRASVDALLDFMLLCVPGLPADDPAPTGFHPRRTSDRPRSRP